MESRLLERAGTGRHWDREWSKWPDSPKNPVMLSPITMDCVAN
jgi:hypothetical protein